ncbi:hypothetical protein DPMN_018560 [Dreissena polymorpha]|uniref:Uncharacterized protein n=1 Tax=Dreissena polymorpha TaxID=45954 RepID=A0A9D4S8H2_DREPO|nr:hypothetical protein DPMN_018560 [Dreissena polymorpha]
MSTPASKRCRQPLCEYVFCHCEQRWWWWWWLHVVVVVVVLVVVVVVVMVVVVVLSSDNHLVDGPTDRPTDRPTNMSKAIYPLFFEGGHKNWGGGCGNLLDRELSSDNHLVDGPTDIPTDRPTYRHEQSNIPPLLRRGA